MLNILVNNTNYLPSIKYILENILLKNINTKTNILPKVSNHEWLNIKVHFR
jgi:hypothetical protein